MTEKIKGCFLGLAVGDALGVPVEFSSREYLKKDPVRTMMGYGTWSQPAGTWSDDSSLTFCLAESLLDKYDLHDIATRSVRWCREGYWGAHHAVFDIGGTTRSALGRIMQGEDPRFAGEHGEESNGNGSLMRIAPAGLYFNHVPDQELYERVREISSITHAHFRSAFSCFILAVYMRELGRGADKHRALQNTGASVSELAAKNDFNKKELALFERILDGTIGSAPEETVGSSGYVLHTLEASLWCFLNTGSFSEAVLKAVNLGEDTDTTGCVTGALAGLYYGVSAIPEAWLKVLARKNDIEKLSQDFAASVGKRML